MTLFLGASLCVLVCLLAALAEVYRRDARKWKDEFLVVGREHAALLDENACLREMLEEGGTHVPARQWTAAVLLHLQASAAAGVVSQGRPGSAHQPVPGVSPPRRLSAPGPAPRRRRHEGAGRPGSPIVGIATRRVRAVPPPDEPDEIPY